MARLSTNFAPTEHSTDQNDFGTIPEGIYSLEVIASDVSIDGRNEAVKVTYAVIAPAEYSGRYVFDWFDINNDDAEKQRRGNQNFSRLCRAIGYDEQEEGVLDDSEKLHFRAFTAKVKDNPAGVSKAGKPYKAKNQIGLYYYPDEGNVPEPAVTVAAPANDNRRPAAAANYNRAATPAAKPAGSKPWGARK